MGGKYQMWAWLWTRGPRFVLFTTAPLLFLWSFRCQVRGQSQDNPPARVTPCGCAGRPPRQGQAVARLGEHAESGLPGSTGDLAKPLEGQHCEHDGASRHPEGMARFV